MDSKSLKDRDVPVDLESGLTIDEDNGLGVKNAKQLLNNICNGLMSAQRAIRGEEAHNLSNGLTASFDIPLENGESPLEKKFGEEVNLGFVENKAEAEQPKKKKSRKKPPKPPRLPRAASLDAADQKLIQEISDLAMLKRARMERMKALMRMKNAKTTSSNGSLWALVITVLFCLVIIWQGFSTRSHSEVNFASSPESSVGTRGQMIPVQYVRNVFPSDPNSPISVSLKPPQLSR